MSEKWSYSRDEEQYFCEFDTKEEAIEALGGEGWVGRCVPPEEVEKLIDADLILERIQDHDEYSGEWADGWPDCTKEQRDDLTASIQRAFGDWIDRHKLRPKFYNIDPRSIEKINCEQL